MKSRIVQVLQNITIQEWIVFSLMIVIGLACRFFMMDYVNVKPVAAFVLFGGFFFRHWSIPMVTLLAIMLCSDFVLGGYELPLMLSVYFSLGIGATLGALIRSRSGRELAGYGWIPAFAGASLTMSTCFFLLTNGAVWLFTGWCPRTFEGLVNCYLDGVPFWRNSIIGDLLFTAGIVGCYWLATRSVAFKASSSFAEKLEIGTSKT